MAKNRSKKWRGNLVIQHWQNFYQAPQASDWQGRQDAKPEEYYYQIVQLFDLTKNTSWPHKQESPAEQTHSFALLGFASDIGVQRNLGRAGAANGPQTIKQALARLPLHHNITLYDVGSIVVHNNDLESAQAALADVIQILLTQNLIPIVLGGGHETAWGHYQGLEKFLAKKPLSIINFDAHFDLRDIPDNQQGTSGTPFRQIAATRQKQNLAFDYNCIGIQKAGNTQHLFEVAQALKVNYLLAEDMYLHDNKYSENFLAPIIAKAEKIYLTICLDVFAAQYAPGVSAPQVLGISPWQLLSLLKMLLASGKILSLDFVELAPNFDVDQRTAKLAALLINEVLQDHSLIRI